LSVYNCMCLTYDFFMHFVPHLYLSLLFFVVCRRYHILFTLFVFSAHSGVQRILRCVFFLFSSLFVPYVVKFSRFSIFALHFGILLRLFCRCGRYILILLDKCMRWWFHVRINTNYVRYRSQHMSDDGMYCMWLISLSIYNLFLYIIFSIFV